MWIHLGVKDEEKFHPQMVSFNIDLAFNSCPLGAETDRLEDAVCYVELVQLVVEHCQSRSFNLIENLGKTLHDKITEFLLPYNDLIQAITLKVHKVSPPLPGVHGGVTWTHHMNYGKNPDL